MRSAKTILGSLAVSVAVWGLFAWPLPRHFMTAIPASAHHRWPAEVRPTMPGDHLQFLYYCWLTSDWLAGRTPACNNLYEFNTGDDQAGFRLDSYYAPFSLVYSLGAWLGGRAFGWNLTGLLSLWLTYLLTLLLVRRYTASAIIPWLAALLSITPTFRWINLAGGSPAGFAMAWVPAVFLGLDLAIRDRRARGGWLAGLAVLGAACGDRHVFFFSMLAAPGWCVVAALAAAEWPGKSWPLFRQTLRALLPLAALVVLALALPAILHAGTRLLSGQEPVALTAGTRSMRDVMNYSPEWTGYWGLSPLGISDQIYLGYTVSALLLGGWLHLLWGMVRRRGTPPIRAFILLTAIGLGLGLAMVLALGARSIMDARLFQLVRRVIPYYTLIRQPAKILCLLPTLLAVGAGLSLAALSELFRQRAVRLILATLLVTLVAWEARRRVEPTVMFLDQQQGAYAAAVADAATRGLAARAVVVPLWPGDSHYSSLYQYYASLYRLRMINGYNPFIKRGYFEEVFKHLFSINQGLLTDAQLASLRKMGVGYLLFHENLFPEMVSPFPAARTLKNLLAHPRLALLKQDGPVWAFRLLDAARPHPDPVPDWNLFFPARRWEAERCVVKRTCTVQTDEAAGGQAYATLSQTNSAIALPPEHLPGRPALHWLIRARGRGELLCTQLRDQQAAGASTLAVDAPSWTWLSLPVTTFTNFALVGLKLERQSGGVDLDTALLVDGDWQPPAPGQTFTWPAAIFFHSGCSDIATGSAVFRSATEAPGIVFYGPKLPLEPGLYEVTVDKTSPAAAGINLGALNLEEDDNSGRGRELPVVAGQPTIGLVRLARNTPFKLVFLYSGRGDVTFRQIALRRLE